MLMRSAIVSLALVATVCAQNDRQISYSQDTLSMGGGNIVPLGSFPGSPNFEEGRWQELIPATHLPPTAGLIVGMSVICQTYTGPLVYQKLEIDMGHTTASALGTSFATNLPSPSNVLNQTAYSVNYTAWQWTRINFDTPFVYNGTDNLVFEIRKVATTIASGIATMAVESDPGRPDLPRTRYAYGTLGSGAWTTANATASTSPLMVRLHWMRTPTMYLKSDRIATGSGNTFALGGNVDFVVDATPGSMYVTLLAGSFVAPYAIPGVVGNAMLLPAASLPTGTIAGPGPGVQSLTIPLTTGLIGAHFAVQSAVIDVGLGGAVFMTNGTDFFIRTN